MWCINNKRNKNVKPKTEEEEAAAASAAKNSMIQCHCVVDVKSCCRCRRLLGYSTKWMCITLYYIHSYIPTYIPAYIHLCMFDSIKCKCKSQYIWVCVCPVWIFEPLLWPTKVKRWCEWKQNKTTQSREATNLNLKFKKNTR